MPNLAQASTRNTHTPIAPPNSHHRIREPNHDMAPSGLSNTSTNHAYKKKVSLTIATININRATTSSNNMNMIEKWVMIKRTIWSEKIAILALQEMHLNEEHANNIHRCFSRSFDLHYSPVLDSLRTIAGVPFIVNKALIAPHQITVNTLIPGQVTVLTLMWPDIGW